MTIIKLTHIRVDKTIPAKGKPKFYYTLTWSIFKNKDYVSQFIIETKKFYYRKKDKEYKSMATLFKEWKL